MSENACQTAQERVCSPIVAAHEQDTASDGTGPQNGPEGTMEPLAGLRVYVGRHARMDDWAFANGYDPDAPFGQCTIDRIDVDGDYEPSNCRWVDATTQNANRRPFKHQNGWTKAKEESDAVH